MKHKLVSLLALSVLFSSLVFAQGHRDRDRGGNREHSNSREQKVNRERRDRDIRVGVDIQSRRGRQLIPRSKPPVIVQPAPVGHPTGEFGQYTRESYSGRIPFDRFHERFGREHTFRTGRLVYFNGQPRFRCYGYWFVIEDPWPIYWDYDDYVYIEYWDGVYYLCNPRFPGSRIVVEVIY